MLQEKLTAVLGVFMEQEVAAAVVMDIDKTWCGIQALGIENFRAVRDNHLSGTSVSDGIVGKDRTTQQ